MSDELEAAEAKVAALTAENRTLQDSVWALESKVDALAPHETCACSWDRPDDMCDHHSPRVVALRTALEHIANTYDESWREGSQERSIGNLARAALGEG